jgi:hypothetical protein
MDELGSVWLRESGGDGGEEGLHLDLAMGAEARCDTVEVVVVIAGMADEFVGSFRREGVEDLGEGGGVEVAGGGDAYSPLRGEDMSVVDLGLAIEGGFQFVEEADLKAALEVGVGELSGECGFEGVAYGGNFGAFENFEEGACNGREEVCVFVGVDVGDVDARVYETGDLRIGFAHDVFLTDLTEEKSAEEGDEGGAERFAVGADEGGDLLGRGGRSAICEDDVAADAERGVGASDGDGVLECGAGGHEGGGGERSGLVELKDGEIDARGEAEVVCVDDEAGGHDFGLEMMLARHFGRSQWR